MKITNFELHSKQELIQIIKNTTLAGDNKIMPFKNSEVSIKQSDANYLFPTQKFVLQDQLQKIEFLYNWFLRFKIDISNLDGFIVYKMYNSANVYVLTPPIIEVIDNQPLVIDGQHRTKFFADKGLNFKSVYIENIAKEYWPYQLPNKNGWNDVQVFDSELPDGFVRKDLRYSDKAVKKFMFREYPFPGIIKIAREHTGKSY